MTRILIVDDDQTTLASLSRAFRLAGYEAVVCDNASRAIALLRNERFDLVFSDVVMPGKDGLSMLAELRDIGVTTPIIMISGQASVDMAVRATRLGAVERDVVLGELSAHGYRIAETARALGLERSHLYKKCQQLGIDLKAERAQS